MLCAPSSSVSYRCAFMRAAFQRLRVSLQTMNGYTRLSGMLSLQRRTKRVINEEAIRTVYKLRRAFLLQK